MSARWSIVPQQSLQRCHVPVVLESVAIRTNLTVARVYLPFAPNSNFELLKDEPSRGAGHRALGQCTLPYLLRHIFSRIFFPILVYFILLENSSICEDVRETPSVF